MTKGIVKLGVLQANQLFMDELNLLNVNQPVDIGRGSPTALPRSRQFYGHVYHCTAGMPLAVGDGGHH